MQSTPATPRADVSPATILVVDDSHTIRQHVSEILASHYRVLTAESGAKALELVATEPKPDLILLDLVMPGMDGYEVLKQLRAMPATRDIPVIILTGRGAEDDEAHGLVLGAVDYMTKPLRPAILLARLSNHLELKATRDVLRNQNALLEARVMERTKTLHAILDSADQTIAMILPDGAIMAINRIGAKQFQATPSSLAGRNFFDLLPAKFAGSLRQRVTETMATGRSTEIDDVREDQTWHTTIFPVAGSPPRVVIYAVDVTDYVETQARMRREQEQLAESLAHQRDLNQKLEQAQTQLLQSEKMASLGQLAAGVAHEINNPIGFVNSNLGTMEGYLHSVFEFVSLCEDIARTGAKPDDLARIDSLREQKDIDYIRDDIFQLMTESRDGMDRLRKIVLDLKNFSRVGGTDWEWSDLHAGMDSTLNIVWNELKYKCKVTKHYAADLPKIHCLPSQLNQVFMNLLVNASHAIEEQGVIDIATEQVAPDQVRIRISDNGQGISEDNLKRIFDPFFTTKPVGKGTGLGLSIAYGIVAKHHGTIAVESALGRGTTFTISLPVDPALFSHAAELQSVTSM